MKRRCAPTYPFRPIVRPSDAWDAFNWDWATVPVKLVQVPGLENGMSIDEYRMALIRHGSDSLPLVDGRLG